MIGSSSFRSIRVIVMVLLLLLLYYLQFLDFVQMLIVQLHDIAIDFVCVATHLVRHEIKRNGIHWCRNVVCVCSREGRREHGSASEQMWMSTQLELHRNWIWPMPFLILFTFGCGCGTRSVLTFTCPPSLLASPIEAAFIVAPFSIGTLSPTSTGIVSSWPRWFISSVTIRPGDVFSPCLLLAPSFASFSLSKSITSWSSIGCNVHYTLKSCFFLRFSYIFVIEDAKRSYSSHRKCHSCLNPSTDDPSVESARHLTDYLNFMSTFSVLLHDIVHLNRKRSYHVKNAFITAFCHNSNFKWGWDLNYTIDEPKLFLKGFWLVYWKYASQYENNWCPWNMENTNALIV